MAVLKRFKKINSRHLENCISKCLGKWRGILRGEEGKLLIDMEAQEGDYIDKLNVAPIPSLDAQLIIGGIYKFILLLVVNGSIYIKLYAPPNVFHFG